MDKQYRITSETFRLAGEDSTIPDAYVDPVQLAELKKLAGVDPLGLMAKHIQSGKTDDTDQA